MNQPRSTAPRQARSRRTEQRIVATAHALARAGRLQAISTPELARRAGVSVGGFYRRFSSKADLAAHLAIDALAEHWLRRVEDVLQDDAVRRLPVLEILRRYYTLAAEAFATHRQVLAVAARLAREEPASEVATRIREFNERAHERLRAVVLRHPELERRRGLRQAFDVGLLAASAALREVVLYGQPVSALDAGALATLVDELSWAHGALLTRDRRTQKERKP